MQFTKGQENDIPFQKVACLIANFYDVITILYF
jgi:hypothetical protein